MRKLFFPILSTFFLCLLMIGSVSAQWLFTDETVPANEETIGLTLTSWLYSSEEVLPNEVSLGESHLDLIQGILGENPNVNKNHSINGKDAIENAVKKQQTLYWFENITGSNLKHTFTTETSKEVEFVMSYDSETGNILLFTYRKEDLNLVSLGVTNIEVYVTVLVKENDEWNDLGSMVGHSVVTLHSDENHRIVDPANFRPGPIPE